MRLLLLTSLAGPAADALPSLELLTHQVRVLPAEAGVLLDAPPHDALLVDGSRSLPQARSLCRFIRTTGATAPVLLIVTEGGLSALQSDWGMDDVLLCHAGPAEIEARLRLAVGALHAAALDSDSAVSTEIRRGDLVIDEAAYSSRVGSRGLDLTFKEFELLKFLAQHPGRVFTRSQLLQEVWGYDYYGGTRTVDVHVRRLRAKLGLEYDGLIGTVRNVGYRFVPQREGDDTTTAAKAGSSADEVDLAPQPADGTAGGPG